MRRLVFALLGLLACVGAAQAQAPVVPWCATGTSPPFAPCSATYPLPITGGGASATFGAAFPSTGSPGGFSDGTLMQPARVTSAAIGDATTPPTSQIMLGQNFNMVWNGATWDRAGGMSVGTFGSPATDVVSVQNNDPCSYAAKSSVPISITSATTTSLVALSGSTVIYVCGFSLTISQVVTTANTFVLEYGTGATCGTGTTALTGTFGAGGVTAGIPIVITYGSGNSTVATAPAGNRLCALTAIGGSGSFQGILTYVQQ